MRLTLRYLLAYLHGVDLSPEDAQEIGRRIDESERATGLVHRIRDVVRRLRLGAPSVSERGQWLDPNTVAEYLDNRLPDSQVPDFEKVCFESDVQLAEVASCHEILATVLHEPAEVDPVSRQRMYRLAEAVRSQEAQRTNEAEEPAVSLPGAGDAAGAHPAAHHARPTVPEYLRRSAARRTWWRTVAGLAMALAIVLVVLVLAGQIRPGVFLSGLFGGPEAGSEEAASAPENGETPAGGVPAGDDDEKLALARPSERPEIPASEGVRPSAGTKPDAEEAAPPDRSEKPLATAAEGGPVDAKATPAPSKEAPGAAEPDKTKPPMADAAGDGERLKQPPGALEPSPRLASSEAKVLTPAAAASKPQLPAERIGLLTTPGEILLRLNAATGSWLRVAEKGQITAQDRLVSLPLFKPVIAMPSAHALVHLIGGTGARLLPSGTQGVPGLAVEYGRVIVRPDAGGPARMRLQIGDRTGMVTFADADSTLGIDVWRTAATGNDPETQPGPAVGDLYVTTGKVLWEEEPNGKPMTLTSPIRAALSEHALDTTALQQFPRWVLVDSPLEPLEQQTATTLERGVTTDRTASLSLRELAEHRRKEVRALAIRSLVLIEDYDPILEALNNPDERVQWDDYVDQLREAVVRSPRAAALVRTAMERTHGDEGATLYEMLWKYRTDTLTPAEARLLVKYLDHETLIFRVLALWNLRNLTGVELKYRPDDPSSKRQPAIQRWKERLNSLPALRPRTAEEGKPRAGEPRATPPRSKTPGVETRGEGEAGPPLGAPLR